MHFLEFSISYSVIVPCAWRTLCKRFAIFACSAGDDMVFFFELVLSCVHLPRFSGHSTR